MQSSSFLAGNQSFNHSNVFDLGLLLTFTLVAFPSIPLSFSFELVERWLFSVVVTNGSLLVQSIQLELILITEIEVFSLSLDILSSFLETHW